MENTNITFSVLAESVSDNLAHDVCLTSNYLIHAIAINTY